MYERIEEGSSAFKKYKSSEYLKKKTRIFTWTPQISRVNFCRKELLAVLLPAVGSRLEALPCIANLFTMEIGCICWKCPQIFPSEHPALELIRNLKLGFLRPITCCLMAVDRHHRRQERLPSVIMNALTRGTALSNSAILQNILIWNIHLNVSAPEPPAKLLPRRKV